MVRGLVQRSGIEPGDVEDLIVGCAFPEGEQGFNVARIVGLLTGSLPISVAGATVNRFCGSSMQSVHTASGAVRMNAGEAFICAGVESMSRVPMGGYNPLPNRPCTSRSPPPTPAWVRPRRMSRSAYRITREEQEAFAFESQRRAAAACAGGRLDAEIVRSRSAVRAIDRDGCIRKETSLEGLADLAPAFLADGTVTAGTSSPLTDGAAAVVVCSEAYANEHGLEPLARVKSIAVSGCAPEVMGIGPVSASRKALDRAGIDAADIDVVELNEAFAAQAIACMRELGLDHEKVNIDGGAIALGHPARRDRAPHHRQGGGAACARGRAVCSRDPVHRRRQGIATVLEAVH